MGSCAKDLAGSADGERLTEKRTLTPIWTRWYGGRTTRRTSICSGIR